MPGAERPAPAHECEETQAAKPGTSLHAFRGPPPDRSVRGASSRPRAARSAAERRTADPVRHARRASNRRTICPTTPGRAARSAARASELREMSPPIEPHVRDRVPHLPRRSQNGTGRREPDRDDRRSGLLPGQPERQPTSSRRRAQACLRLRRPDERDQAGSNSARLGSARARTQHAGCAPALGPASRCAATAASAAS